MHSKHSHPHGGHQHGASSHGAPGHGAAKPRYSAKKMSKPVHFYCEAPEAKQVAIVGDFNNWDPLVHPMQQMPDRVWRIEVTIHHGHHQYAFMVDGKLTLDPRAQGISRNEKNERVSLIAVS
jgi:1,4-alpha-glucan branching enzyme